MVFDMNTQRQQTWFRPKLYYMILKSSTVLAPRNSHKKGCFCSAHPWCCGWYSFTCGVSLKAYLFLLLAKYISSSVQGDDKYIYFINHMSHLRTAEHQTFCKDWVCQNLMFLLYLCNSLWFTSAFPSSSSLPRSLITRHQPTKLNRLGFTVVLS